MFITFEGIDGSGKSSLSKLVFDKLLDMGIKGVHTFEPTDSFIGKSIREIVLFSNEKLSISQQILLFSADRISHCSWIKKKQLEYQFVICDRFIHSTLAYQGIDEKMVQSIYTIHDLFLKKMEPDIVFLIDIQPEISLQRIGKEKTDNFEKVEFLSEVRIRYLNMAKANPDKFIILDGVSPLDELLDIVLELLSSRFGLIKEA